MEAAAVSNGHRYQRIFFANGLPADRTVTMTPRGPAPRKKALCTGEGPFSAVPAGCMLPNRLSTSLIARDKNPAGRLGQLSVTAPRARVLCNVQNVLFRPRPTARKSSVPSVRPGLWTTLIAILLLLGCSSRPPLPAQAVSLNNQGIQALASGDLETASARFQLALEYNPRFVEALSNQALVELERGNLTRAGQLLRRARRINPNIAQPHHALGVLAEREGRKDDASEHYRAALAIDPGFAPARLNLAHLLFDANLLYHAKLEFEKLIQAAPEAPEGYAGLAETLIRLGRRQEAEAIIAGQAERFPHSADLQLLVARTEMRNGDVGRAVERLVALTHGDDRTRMVALSWLAVAELARDRPRHAVGAAKRALELDENSPVARHALAQALEKLGDPRARLWKLRPP